MDSKCELVGDCQYGAREGVAEGAAEGEPGQPTRLALGEACGVVALSCAGADDVRLVHWSRVVAVRQLVNCGLLALRTFSMREVLLSSSDMSDEPAGPALEGAPAG